MNGKLTILDDYFPNLTTGFRISEFNYYLEKFPTSEVISTRYDMHNAEYVATYPQFSGRVKPFTAFDWTGKSTSLYYSVFLGNAYSFYFIYEMFNTPFIFELYPGGSYWLNDPEVDEKLQKVLKSPLLQKVIVTQKMTYDDIINRGFVSPDKVAYIYGIVTHPQYFQSTPQKKHYKTEKQTFDICFVAHKYMAGGIDKGYHIFIDVCKRLAATVPDILFHVVGNFNSSDYDITGLENRIIFHGLKDHTCFPDFYSGMDIIVSPNAPFLLIPGRNFDGFPTGCCIDAALHGVGVLCSDLLNQNTSFVNGKDICIISLDPASITANILDYYSDPKKLYQMSECGQAKFREVFDFEDQMSRRAAVLQQFL
ncbi:glycosyltransferase family 4 protein [Anaerocolumna sp. AGMB13025]|uniref:glycosyltransferase family 4 protein n=1 Tax=Anaerocolumna sp. AGMB13025 TaxID=3039116 RepID=UPI00241D4F95|nr:glycosyltransferase family 4 protein [Anaerocolumna sp. AGMB13025]WFR59246.1 glycosyltransferase family 4 protein [Anaerocolumna sp. AGMB13025]